MNWQLLVPLLVTTTLGLIGWFAVHRLSAARDRANKQRDLRAAFLIESYRAIAGISHCSITPDNAPAIAKAFFDIQLFGTPLLIDLAHKVAIATVHKETAELDELLSCLRSELRDALGLAHIAGPIWTWRFVTDEENNIDSGNEVRRN